MLQAQDHYLKTRVQTSTPAELTLMLYNGCIRFVKLGMNCLDQADIAGKHTNFVKAQNIIEELQSTLKMEYEISRNLSSLYSFIHSKITEANVKLDCSSAEYSLSMLIELRDTWVEAMKSLKSQSQVQST